MSAALAPDWLQQFSEQGYIHVPGLLSEDVLLPVQQLLERWVDAVLPGHRQDEPFTRRLAAMARDIEASGEPNPVRPLLRGMNEIWMSTPSEPAQAMFNLVTNKALVDVVAQLCQVTMWPASCPGKQAHSSSSERATAQTRRLSFHRGICRPKLPNTDEAAFPLHQDSQYFDLECAEAKDSADPTVVEPGYATSTANITIVSAWVPLVDCTPETGCLEFIPGSHRWGMLSGGRDDLQNMRAHEDVRARHSTRRVPAARGDVIFFHNLVFHGSGVNNSDIIRWSLDWRYHAAPLSAPVRAQGAAALVAAKWWAKRAWWSCDDRDEKYEEDRAIEDDYANNIKHALCPPWSAWTGRDPVGLEVGGHKGLDVDRHAIRQGNATAQASAKLARL